MTTKGQSVHRRSIRTAALAAALLVTAGCTGKADPSSPATSRTSAPVISQPAATPTPSTTISVPASMSPAEAKAVANAIEAYKQWVAAQDVLTRSGGRNTKPLEELATQAALNAGKQTAALYAQNGWHSVGSTEIRRISALEISLVKNPSTRSVPEVILASCADASNTDVFDAKGESVVPQKQRRYTEKAWIRYYPKSEYPGVGAGFAGWLVGQYENAEATEC